MKVRLGVIGTGIAATTLHLPALQQLHDKYDVVVACNRTEQKAKEYAALLGGVPYVLDYRDVLKRSDVDAVIVAVPIHLTYQVARDAIRTGKHVMIEKPLAASLRQARRLVELATASPAVTMVAEDYRYRPAFQIVKSYLDAGEIGDPFWACWTSFELLEPSNPYAQTAWRIHQKYPGGYVTDGGIHKIAALREIFGDVASGMATTSRVNPTLGPVDSLMLLFKTANGLDGIYAHSFSVHGYHEDRLVVMGTAGSITVEPSQITIAREGVKLRRETIAAPLGYVGEFEDFHSAIVRDTPVRSTVEEGYRDLEVILTALRSAELGRPFRLLRSPLAARAHSARPPAARPPA
jgi:predicted dehydrogenase